MSVYVCLGEGERLRLEIFTPYTMHVIKTCMYAKYQCTLYTIQLVSEFVVREALPHLPAVRVSAGVFFFLCVFIETGLAVVPPTALEVYCRSSDCPFRSAHISQDFTGSWAYESRLRAIISQVLTIVYCIISDSIMGMSLSHPYYVQALP